MSSGLKLYILSSELAMETILIVVHLLFSLALIGLVLIQHGRGADAGAAFGSGASATVFGARGATSFLSRTTAILATFFFISSLILAYFSSQTTKIPGLMEGKARPTSERSEMARIIPKSSEVPVVPMPVADIPEASTSVADDAQVEGKRAASGNQSK